MDSALFTALASVPVLTTVAVVLLTLFGMLREASRYFMFARMAEDMPTATIHSAAQGYREIQGTTEGLFQAPLQTPLTRTPCLWYRYKIEKYVGGDSNDWEMIEQEESEQVFLIRDETGKCIIDPQRANITPRIEHTWYGPTPKPTTAPQAESPSFVWLNKNTKFRYSEARIESGETLYAIGDFSSHTDVPEQIASRCTRQLITQWKEDQTQLHQAFDKNGDGVIDKEEWQQAQKLAHHIATKQLRPTDCEQVHLISCPTVKSHPYLLSTRSEPDMVSRYRKRMLLALAGFAAALAYGAAMLDTFNGG